MITLEEMNSECFRYDNHESDFGTALGLSYAIFSTVPEWKEPELHHALRKYAIGWCESQHVMYKPRYGWIAIMCEKDGDRFWFHIMDRTFRTIFETNEGE